MERKSKSYRPGNRTNAWVLNPQVERIKKLQPHPAIPFRVALDECIEEGIKAMEKARGRQRRAQTVVQG